ncbi:hypothetical protein HETIRDRAFT_426215 [Heterobasidion irregulare TC 32-1]|uniref:Uncharacterized protein n=1 Tax=Heterobasidion irregulare (strain TC 32-1) TaxID=747525 RepID=W4K9S8_HETIT|nr:uncharacterized protein HETIRDRAFT_426215 [Heterobasidion irregulare TC 32-1]ETW82602.1 hypothetical protein HETIRDRAFT_426215 [Heterobasidion irregulare TC 32-1]
MSSSAPHPSDSTYLIEAGVGVIIQTLFYGKYFDSSSAVWALSLVRFIMIIKTIDSSNPTLSPEHRVYTNQASEHMGIIVEVISSINPMLSDAVVTWRAWSAIGCAANDFYTNETLCRDVQYIGLGLMLLTNIVATSSIAVTAWRHRRFIMANLGPKSKKTHAEKILVLLIESGMLYCLICATPILFLFIKLPTEVYMIQWMWPTMTHISGIYPTGVLLIVAIKRTIWDSLSEFENQVSLPDIRFRSAPGDVEDTGTQYQFSDPRQIYPSVAGQAVAKEAVDRLSATPSINESVVIW